MAATVSAWGKPGAWALDAEENEAEFLQQQQNEDLTNQQANGGATEADFPSLAVAATSKTKKKKPQTLSLQEFTSYGAGKQSNATGAGGSQGLTPEEMMMLPTAPRLRTAEELERTRIGGGFRSYDTRPARGSSDEPRRQGVFNREISAPSRADEIDNWAATKKSIGGNGFERRERGGGGSFSHSQSRADEVDNWASNKAFVPSEGRKYDRRRVGFESNGGGADSDYWVKRKEEEAQKFGGSFDSLRARRGNSESMNRADSDNWGRKGEEGSDGVATARPRLNLKPRTLPLNEDGNTENTVKPKGSNPFGEARPREEVLKEKGQDWKEIDEKLKNVKMKQVDSPGLKQRGFGSGNGRASLQEDWTERAWRKPESMKAHPLSSGESENGHHVEETQDSDQQV